MENFATSPLGGKLQWCWSLLAVSALTAGCAVTESNLWPAQPVPCQIAMKWDKKIAFAADPTQGGKMNPGLAGRLYLIGETYKDFLTCDGELVVQMYDESSKGKSVLVEQWDIDPTTLHRLMRQDFLGCGYTLFLPSASYNPNITAIRLKAGFKRKDAVPLYTENVVMLGDDSAPVYETRSSTPLPVIPPSQTMPVLPSPAPGPSLPVLPPPIQVQ